MDSSVEIRADCLATLVAEAQGSLLTSLEGLDSRDGQNRQDSQALGLLHL